MALFVGEEGCAQDVSAEVLAAVEASFGRVLFATLMGSRRYNLHRPTSDYDYFVVYDAPLEALLDVHPPKDTHISVSPDTIAMDASAFARGLLDGDLRCLEALFAPPAATLVATEAVAPLLHLKAFFVTKTVTRALTGWALGPKSLPNWLQRLKAGQAPPAVAWKKIAIAVRQLMVAVRSTDAVPDLALWHDPEAGVAPGTPGGTTPTTPPTSVLLDIRAERVPLAGVQALVGDMQRTLASRLPTCMHPVTVLPGVAWCVRQWLAALRRQQWVPLPPLDFSASVCTVAGLAARQEDAAAELVLAASGRLWGVPDLTAQGDPDAPLLLYVGLMASTSDAAGPWASGWTVEVVYTPPRAHMLAATVRDEFLRVTGQHAQADARLPHNVASGAGVAAEGERVPAMALQPARTAEAHLNVSRAVEDVAWEEGGLSFSVCGRDIGALGRLLVKASPGALGFLSGVATALGAPSAPKVDTTHVRRRVLYASEHMHALLDAVPLPSVVTAAAPKSWAAQTKGLLKAVANKAAVAQTGKRPVTTLKQRRAAKKLPPSVAPPVVPAKPPGLRALVSADKDALVASLHVQCTEVGFVADDAVTALRQGVPMSSASVVPPVNPWLLAAGQADLHALVSGVAEVATLAELLPKPVLAGLAAAPPVGALNAWVSGVRCSLLEGGGEPGRAPPVAAPTPALLSLLELLEVDASKVEPSWVVAACQTGSAMYNLATPTSDRDFAIIWVAPTRAALAFQPPPPRFAVHVVKPFASDKHDDVEYSAVELEAFVGDLLKGNPRNLELLLAEPSVFASPMWQDLRAHWRKFLCRRTVFQYVGFVKDRLSRASKSLAEGDVGPVCKLCYHAMHKLLGLEAILRGETPPVRLEDGPERDAIMAIRQPPGGVLPPVEPLVASVTDRLAAAVVEAESPTNPHSAALPAEGDVEWAMAWVAGVRQALLHV